MTLAPLPATFLLFKRWLERRRHHLVSCRQGCCPCATLQLERRPRPVCVSAGVLSNRLFVLLFCCCGYHSVFVCACAHGLTRQIYTQAMLCCSVCPLCACARSKRIHPTWSLDRIWCTTGICLGAGLKWDHLKPKMFLLRKNRVFPSGGWVLPIESQSSEAIIERQSSIQYNRAERQSSKSVRVLHCACTPQPQG